MHTSTFFNRFTLLTLTFIIVANCFSQSKTIIGLNLTGEHTSASDNVPGFGATFERQFGKHSGVETGLYYRPYNQYIKIFVDGSLYDAPIVREQYLSVPIVYKFYSSLLNVSAGPGFDIYTGWKQVSGKFPFPNNPFSVRNKFQVGLLGKVSKTIVITKRLFVEPEFRYNRVFYERKFYYGLGIAAK